MNHQGQGHRWAVVTAASGTVMIGAGAFWLSFTALADLARRSGIAGQAWIWPLLVDGLIVVATVAVVALDGRRAAWYPWALLAGGAGVSVTANAAHAIVAAEATVPGLLAAVVAAIPPLVLLAATHLTVVLTRRTGQDAHAVLAVPDEAANPGGHETERAEPQTAPKPETAPEPDAGPDVKSLPISPAHALTPTAPAADQRRPETSAASVSRQERAEALRGKGWSNKRIARELGVHPSTVGRWFTTPAPEPSGIGTSGDESTGDEEEHHDEKEQDHESARA